MAQLCEDGAGEGEFQKVEVYTINPLALSNDEIYGCFDPASHEWTTDPLALMPTSARTSPNQKWTLFDGPVDTLWIESMNTLLDDNKLLTLLSGGRIMMSPQVSILFEVEDLSQACPATVSARGYDLPQRRGPGGGPSPPRGSPGWSSDTTRTGRATKRSSPRCTRSDEVDGAALEFRRPSARSWWRRISWRCGSSRSCSTL